MKHHMYSNFRVLLNSTTRLFFFFNAIIFLLFPNKVGTKVKRKNAASLPFQNNPPHALLMENI